MKILALCANREMGESFIQSSCEEPMEGWGMRRVEGRQIRLETLTGDPRLNPYWHHHVCDAKALVILVRFMDMLSMDGLKMLYRSLPLDSSIPPLVFFVLRQDGEADYKLSCQECGQKLWVRDADVGKTGRCPNCRTAFSIPAQIAFLREQLALPDNLPIETVSFDDPHILDSALMRLLRRAEVGDHDVPEQPAVDLEAMKRSTIRIQIPENLSEEIISRSL